MGEKNHQQATMNFIFVFLPNLYAEILTPSGIVLGDGTFGR